MGLPETVIRTPRQRNTIRQYTRWARDRPGSGMASSTTAGNSSSVIDPHRGAQRFAAAAGLSAAGPHAALVAGGPRQPGVLGAVRDGIPPAMSTAADTDRNRFEVVDVGGPLVQQGREVADAELRVVRRFARITRAPRRR